MRLPYIPAEPKLSKPEDQAVVERVLARRGGTLIPLDRALLHAPAVADGWNSFLGAIRTSTSLPAAVRETAICRVAAINKAWFEWESHAPILVREGGMEVDVADELKQVDAVPSGKGWDGRLSAVVKYTDAMTKNVVVPQGVFEELKSYFGEQEVVEITATVAAYNCVSRFLVALDVAEMGEKYGVDMS